MMDRFHVVQRVRQRQCNGMGAIRQIGYINGLLSILSGCQRNGCSVIDLIRHACKTAVSIPRTFPCQVHAVCICPGYRIQC